MYLSSSTDVAAEGLFLKALDSPYNDARRGHRWVKLKKDYIPGLGDTGSFCVIGGGWDKERGRQLGGKLAIALPEDASAKGGTVAPSTYTTWWIGLQTNRLECLRIVRLMPSNRSTLDSAELGSPRPDLTTTSCSSRIATTCSDSSSSISTSSCDPKSGVHTLTGCVLVSQVA